MSAWMVSDLQFSAVINKMVEFDIILEKDIVKIGQMLVDENIKSLVSRYGKGEQKENEHSYTHTNLIVTDEQAFKFSHCIRYQSCEHDTWKTSNTCGFLITLEKVIEKKLNKTSKQLSESWDKLAWSI